MNIYMQAFALANVENGLPASDKLELAYSDA
jgi:hypothetical protein